MTIQLGSGPASVNTFAGYTLDVFNDFSDSQPASLAQTKYRFETAKFLDLQAVHEGKNFAHYSHSVVHLDENRRIGIYLLWHERCWISHDFPPLISQHITPISRGQEFFHAGTPRTVVGCADLDIAVRGLWRGFQ